MRMVILNMKGNVKKGDEMEKRGDIVRMGK